MDCSTPGFPVHHQLLELVQTHVHWDSDAIQPSHPLPSPSLPTFNLSQHHYLFQWSQFFSSGGQSTGVSASVSVLPIFIQDWFPLRWTGLISLQSKVLSRSPTPQFKASILWCSVFLIIQLSHPYMTTGKTIALTRWTSVSKIMSLLFNMLSRLVITFLPRIKCLLISWLQSPSAVISEPKKVKSLTVSPSNLPWSDGIRCQNFSFLNVEF